jgi:hypothetical protein
MFAASWLRQLQRRWFQRRWFGRRLVRRAPVRRMWPCLEALEDRMLLTAWTPIGPAPIVSGPLAGHLPDSGRVTGVAPDPKDVNTIYIASAGGGIWKTTDATDANPTWTPLTDHLTDSNGNPLPEFMGAVAETDATSGKYSGNQIVYAGTGEANNSSDSFYGEGILVSIDGGKDWTLTNAGGAFNGMTVSKIAIDPSDPTGATAYAAIASFGTNGNHAPTGIAKTTNFGQSWAYVTSGINGRLDVSWTDVVIDPHTPSTVYAAVGQSGGYSLNGVYKSTDGGNNWTLLNGTGSVNGTQDGRITLALYDDGTTNELFVSIANPSNGGLYKMLKSTDGGNSFTDLTSDLTLGNYLGNQGDYDTTLIIDPKDPNLIYAGGQDEYIYGGSPIISYDAGADWNVIDLDSAENGPHSDDHAVAFDAAGNLIDGNDGGVFKLTDPISSTNYSWSSLNTNLQITQFYGVAVDPTTGNVYGGNQDNGEVKYTGPLGWNEIYGGDGGITRVDPTNPNIVYEEYVYGDLHISTNAGGSFSSITNGIKHNNDSNGNPIVNFIAPYVLDNLGDIYFGTDYVNLSTNHGSSWTQIGTPGTNGFNTGDAPIDAIAVSPVGDVVYVSAGGKLFVTQNAQDQIDPVTWTEIDLPGGVKAGAPNSLAIDPSDGAGGAAYAVVNSFQGGGNHVFQTTNYGQSWTDISGNLPNTPCWSVAVSSGGNTVYVGTDVGVYSTSNVNGGSTSWSQFGAGLPNAQVDDLDLVPSLVLLVAGTHGRGAWETTPLILTPLVYNVTSNTANGTYTPGATISIQLTFNTVVFVNTSGGTPTLALNSGGTASYSSGSGTKTLTFTYKVGAGDTTNGDKLDYSSSSALILNGGIIQDAGGDNADLTLPYDGSTESLSDNTDIVIDTTPTVTNVSSSTANGTYGTGAAIPIQVTFNENVFVTGTPTLVLSDGETAAYSGGSGTNTLTFTYTVAAGDTSNGNPLDVLSASALSLNGGAIKSPGGLAASLTLPANGLYHSLDANKDIVIDATTPTVTLVGSPDFLTVYSTGALVMIAFDFSENVFVTGTPTLALNDGETAAYDGGSGSQQLLFIYTVAAGDTTHLGSLDYTSPSALSGIITNAGGVAANLALPAPGSGYDSFGNDRIIIDAITPAVTSVSTTTAAGTYGAGAAIPITVNFNDNVFVNGTPTLTLSDGKMAAYSTGNGTQKLTFTYTVAAGDTTKRANLDYASTSALSGTIINVAGTSANLTLPTPASANDTFGNTGINIYAPIATTTSTASTTATFGATSAMLTAQVTSGNAGVTEGTVTFQILNGTTLLGTATPTSSFDSKGNVSVSYALPAGLDAGSYTVEADYSDSPGIFAASSGQASLTITPATPTIAFDGSGYNSSTNSYSFTYSGQTQSASATVTGVGSANLGNAALTYYQSSYASVADLNAAIAAGTAVAVAGGPLDAGTYTVLAYFAGNNNYTPASAIAALTVTPATLTITPTVGQSKVYGAALPALTYTDSGFVTGDSASLLMGSLGTTATASSSVGSYAFTTGTLSASSNYTVVLAANSPTFAVTPASLTVTADNQSMTYGGSVPALTYHYTGLVNGDTSASFTGGLATPATSGSNAGAYAVTQGTLAVTGNYTIGTFSQGTLTVNPATLTITPAAGQSKVYGAAVPTVTYTASGFVNGDTASLLTGSLGTTATASSSVGNYAFTLCSLSAGSNYTVVLTANSPTFAVTPAPLTITANNVTMIQGQALPTFTVSYSGFVLGEDPSVLGGTLTFSTTATSSSLPGTYALTPSGLTSGNYAITFVSGTLTVLSYSQGTADLQSQVDAASLDPSTQSSLDAQLQQAMTLFQASNTTAGVNVLKAFIHRISAQAGKKIDAALADAWIADAQQIINAAG